MQGAREKKRRPPPPRFLPLHKQDPVRLLRGGIRQQNIITSLLEKAKGANTGESFAPGPKKCSFGIRLSVRDCVLSSTEANVSHQSRKEERMGMRRRPMRSTVDTSFFLLSPISLFCKISLCPIPGAERAIERSVGARRDSGGGALSFPLRAPPSPIPFFRLGGQEATLSLGSSPESFVYLFLDGGEEGGG